MLRGLNHLIGNVSFEINRHRLRGLLKVKATLFLKFWFVLYFEKKINVENQVKKQSKHKEKSS